MKLQTGRIWQSKRKRELFKADDLDRIEFLIDRALYHSGDQRAADSGRAIDVYVQYVYTPDEFLAVTIELEVDVCVGISGKFEAADKRRIIAAGKRHGRVDLAVAETNSRSSGLVLSQECYRPARRRAFGK